MIGFAIPSPSRKVALDPCGRKTRLLDQVHFQVEQATRACVLLVFKFQRWCCRADSTSKFEELVGFFSAGFVGWIKLQLRLGEPDVRGPGVEAIIC